MNRPSSGWRGPLLVAVIAACTGFALSTLMLIRNPNASAPWWGSAVQWLMLYAVFGVPAALLLVAAVAGLRSMLHVSRAFSVVEGVLVGAGIGAATNVVISIAVFAGRFAVFSLPGCLVAGAGGGATFAVMLKRPGTPSIPTPPPLAK